MKIYGIYTEKDIRNVAGPDINGDYALLELVAVAKTEDEGRDVMNLLCEFNAYSSLRMEEIILDTRKYKKLE